VNEADWKIHDVKDAMRELEDVIARGEADARQVGEMARREAQDP
jgi:hypothetical protein